MSTPQPGREGSRAAERRRTEVFATLARPTTAPEPPPLGPLPSVRTGRARPLRSMEQTPRLRPNGSRFGPALAGPRPRAEGRPPADPIPRGARGGAVPLRLPIRAILEAETSP